MAENSEPERRCLFCRHWEPAGYVDRGNPLAEERAVSDRYGENVSLAGGCTHPEPIRVGASSRAGCELWDGLES